MTKQLQNLWKVFIRIIKGIGRAEALSNVQSEFRNHSTAAWNHPYYWAFSIKC